MPGTLLERPFIGRHKFVHPRAWFRGSLGGFMREILLSDSVTDLESHVDIHQLRALLQRDSEGRANHSDELDKVATLALTSRVLLQPQARWN
jgi:hypothetical protein